ncbi:RING-H2 finger protein ATL73 [Bienertia sinuspersici]
MQRKLLVVAVPPPTTAENRTMAMDTQLTQANFDTNMVIILAALLCALICALGLNSMVRCVLRCGQRFGVESAQQAAARVSTTGLKKSALRKIPITVYGAEDSKIGDAECPICLGEFIDGEKVRVLPKCNHRFHVSCIDTWLGSHSSCPNCRHSLLEAITSSSKAAEGEETGEQPPRGEGRQEHVVVEVSGGS